MKKLTVSKTRLQTFVDSVNNNQRPTDADIQEVARFVELDLDRRSKVGRKRLAKPNAAAEQRRRSRENNPQNVITFTIK